jgi:Holliday junction DNA helicase RuvB
LSHLVGQRHVIRQVEVALDACQQDCKRFDHTMLVGPPGLGKSALATVIAREMASEFHEVLGQSLNSVADLNGLLLAARDKDVVFVDEAHEIKRMYQTALYLALDKQWRTSILRTRGTTLSGWPRSSATRIPTRPPGTPAGRANN